MRKKTLDDVLESVAATCWWHQWSDGDHAPSVRAAVVMRDVLSGLAQLTAEQSAAFLHSLDLPIGGTGALLWHGPS